MFSFGFCSPLVPILKIFFLPLLPMFRAMHEYADIFDLDPLANIPDKWRQAVPRDASADGYSRPLVCCGF
jgi:hypothetical protein